MLWCSARSYEAQGNEFSYFMLLASSFVLNHMETRERVWGPCVDHLGGGHYLRTTLPLGAATCAAFSCCYAREQH